MTTPISLTVGSHLPNNAQYLQYPPSFDSEYTKPGLFLSQLSWKHREMLLIIWVGNLWFEDAFLAEKTFGGQ